MYYNYENNKRKTIAPLKERKGYDVLYLDEIDKGEPFVTEHDILYDKIVKEETNIIEKILLVKTRN